MFLFAAANAKASFFWVVHVRPLFRDTGLCLDLLASEIFGPLVACDSARGDSF